MIYQCLVNANKRSFVVAKKSIDVTSGLRPWSDIEKSPAYEIVETEDLVPQEAEYAVTLDCSWGALSVPSTRIDGRLLTPVED